MVSSVQLKMSKQFDQRHFDSYGDHSDFKWSAAIEGKVRLFKFNRSNVPWSRWNMDRTSRIMIRPLRPYVIMTLTVSHRSFFTEDEELFIIFYSLSFTSSWSRQRQIFFWFSFEDLSFLKGKIRLLTAWHWHWRLLATFSDVIENLSHLFLDYSRTWTTEQKIDDYANVQLYVWNMGENSEWKKKTSEAFLRDQAWSPIVVLYLAPCSRIVP